MYTQLVEWSTLRFAGNVTPEPALTDVTGRCWTLLLWGLLDDFNAVFILH